MSYHARCLAALVLLVFAGGSWQAAAASGSTPSRAAATPVVAQSSQDPHQVHAARQDVRTPSERICDGTVLPTGTLHSADTMDLSPADRGGIPRGTICNGVGPDLIVADLVSVSNYSSEQIAGEWFCAFSVGPNRCNTGDQEVDWVAGTNAHPVFGQNLFRLKNGRFEQLAQAWLFHSFSALQSTGCCPACTPSGSSARLGVGCLTTNSPGLIGFQVLAGPKWQVNAHTGVFAYPADNPTWSGSTARRLRIRAVDLENTSLGRARFFVEGQCVARDDAAAGNGNNNASYREVAVVNATSSSANFGLLGTTEREQPGIRAWQDVDPSVVETDVQISNEGLIILSAQATDLGGGLWHYEYAVQNLNSDRSVDSFTVPLAPASIVANIGFHDVDYHSLDGDDSAGDANRDGTDWPHDYVIGASSLTWSMVDVGVNSNALRWGTLYNFRFDTDAEPGDVTVLMGLFGPGTPASISGVSVGPVAPPPVCGNGVLESGEECDDGNVTAGDGCDAFCHAEIVDCNGNGRADDQDIACGGGQNCGGLDGSYDCNQDGIPDDCEPEFMDMGIFINELLGDTQDPVRVCMYDGNGDSVLDGRDIQGYVNRLLGP